MPIDPQLATKVRETVGAEHLIEGTADGRTVPIIRVGDVRQVQTIVPLLYEKNVPMVMCGSHSDSAALARVPDGGVAVSLQRLDTIAELDTVSRFAVVGAGVRLEQIEQQAAASNQLFPLASGNPPTTTVGELIAFNGAGDLSLGYGTMRDFVLGLEMVLYDGSLIQVGAQCRKDVTGYDLVRLVVGSEGTLGVVTGATLRVIDRQEGESTVLVGYADTEAAARASLALLEQRLGPVALELLDSVALDAVRAAFELDIPDQVHALVMVRFFGTEQAVAESARRAQAVLQEHGGSFGHATGRGDNSDQLWRAHQGVYPALVRQHPHLRADDVCVPVRHFPEALSRVYELAQEAHVDVTCMARPGDGQLHPILLVDGRDAQQKDRADSFGKALLEHVLGKGGSISGEHGLGATESRFTKRPLSGPAFDLAGRIKHAYDPKDLFNPQVFRGG